jgi:hypothetical protein
MATTTYSTGTVSVGAGSTAVTGVSTAWLTSGVRAGDMFMASGLCVPIAAVNSNTSITLARPWPGAALSGANYDIDYRDDDVRSLAAANTLLQQLTNGTLTSLAALSSAANKLPYFSGASAFATTDLTPAARAVLGLAGASGAKIPVVTGLSTAALRDILGTVSQSGGVPTGAIVERGSNANGWWTRTADGLQICGQSLDLTAMACATASGQVFISDNTIWMYPSGFTGGAPMVWGSLSMSVEGMHGISLRNSTSTTCNVRMFSSMSRAASVSKIAALIAVGRWF